MVAGLLAGAAGGALGTGWPVWADGPAASPRPVRRPSPPGTTERLVEQARLGGVTGFVVADAATGRILESRDADVPVPPASVVKAITAIYALDRLGAGYRFATRVMRVGEIGGPVLSGDLVLAGGGDPVLDTDQLGDLVASLALTGIRRVTGRFLAVAGALPQLDRIAADQPDHVGYNPGLSGLNLNFNRVHFEWRRAAGDWVIAMDARAERFVPRVTMARMAVAPREVPLFTLEVRPGVEDWTVASAALGDGGSRWMPVRQPAVYTAEVFRTLCAEQGIVLPQGEVVRALPAGARRIVERVSPPLADVVRDMLRFSTNLTAEAMGLTATGAGTLRGSGAVMTAWAGRRLGIDARFVDHSGLHGASRVTAGAMLTALIAADRAGMPLRGLLRDVGMRDAKGLVIEGHPVKVRAKTGTLNFVSGLAGFILPPAGRALTFAIFSADAARRGALAMDDREDPEGGQEWTGRARALQAQLVGRWAAAFG